MHRLASAAEERAMDKPEHPASDLGKTGQPLSDRDLEAVNGGAGTVAGLVGPDTSQGAATSIGAMRSITVGAMQSITVGSSQTPRRG
jgi:hypothetical protein